MPSSEKRALSKINLLDDFGEYKKAGQKTGLNFNGHTMSCWFGPLGVDGTGSLYGLTFDYQTASPTKTQFYLLDDYYRVMNHLTE